MAQQWQEEGWPLGLQPLNMRVGLIRNPDFSGSISFSTLITDSPSSTDSSSDLDTESTGSFFHDKSITLGNLIGVSSILDLSGRRGRARKPEYNEVKKNSRSKTWFSLCTKTCINGASPNTPPSLGHFLEAERRAANVDRRTRTSTMTDELDQISGIGVASSQLNSLFMNGDIAPPQVSPDGPVLVGEGHESNSWFESDVQRKSRRDLRRGNRHGTPVLLSCLCAQSAN